MSGEVQLGIEAARPIEQQACEQKGVQIAGKDRDSSNHEDRDRKGYRYGKVLYPGQGEPDRKPGPGESDDYREPEPEIENEVRQLPAEEGRRTLGRRGLYPRGFRGKCVERFKSGNPVPYRAANPGHPI